MREFLATSGKPQRLVTVRLQQMVLIASTALGGCEGASDPAASSPRSGDPGSSTKSPALHRVKVEPWPVSLEVPHGSAIGPVQNVLGEFIDIDTTAGCGADIQLHRSAWSDRSAEDNFAAATRQDGEGYSYPLEEQDADGYRVKVVVGGLGTMRGAEVGTRIGEHFYVCTVNGGITPTAQSKVDCAFEACKTLRAAP